MKIAYFSDTFLPHIGGIEVSLLNITSTLSKKGHQIIIFVPKFKGKTKIYKLNKNTTVIPLSTLPVNINSQLKISIPELQKILNQLKKFNPDVIHFHTSLTIGFMAMLAAKIIKKPLIGTIHYFFTNSYYLEIGTNKFTTGIMKSLYQLVYQYSCFIYGKCDLRLSPSKLLISELKHSGYKKSVKYLPNGILSEQHILPTEQKIKTIKQKYALKDKVVIHFGRLSREKKVEIVIQSFSLVSKNNPDASLLIIGDGPAKTSLQKLVVKLNLQNKVVFAGPIEHSQLISSGILGVADVFVTASPMETHPMVVLEAMSFGLPIVAAKESGVTELITDNGFLVKPGDIKSFAKKTSMLLSDEALNNKMRESSLKNSQEFSINKICNKLLNFYEELITQKKAVLTNNLNFNTNYKKIISGFEKWLSLP